VSTSRDFTRDSCEDRESPEPAQLRGKTGHYGDYANGKLESTGDVHGY